MSNGEEIPDSLSTVKDQLANHLFAEFPDLVTGIAIGLQSGKEGTAGEEILIFIEPAADCELKALTQAAQKATNGKFRLLETGLFYGLQNPAARGSISFYAPSQFNLPQVSAGTLGAVAQIGAKKYALGSSHVFAHNGRVAMGAPIVLPGTLDLSIKPNVTAAALARRTIARLSSFVELKPVNWPPPSPPPPPPPGAQPLSARPSPQNRVDAALAELTSNGVASLVNLTAVQQFPGQVSNVSIPTPVKKNGRTTGETHSQLCIRDWEGYIDLDFGSYYFQNLLAVVGNERPLNSPFAGKGDSGALVVTEIGDQGVGLVTARAFNPNPGPYQGYIVLACPLDSVFSELAPPGTQVNQIRLWRLP